MVVTDKELLKLQLKQGFLVTSVGEAPVPIGEEPSAHLLNDIDKATYELTIN